MIRAIEVDRPCVVLCLDKPYFFVYLGDGRSLCFGHLPNDVVELAQYTPYQSERWIRVSIEDEPTEARAT